MIFQFQSGGGCAFQAHLAGVARCIVPIVSRSPCNESLDYPRHLASPESATPGNDLIEKEALWRICDH